MRRRSRDWFELLGATLRTDGVVATIEVIDPPRQRTGHLSTSTWVRLAIPETDGEMGRHCVLPLREIESACEEIRRRQERGS